MTAMLTLIALLLLIAAPAAASPVEVAWSEPTTCVDGTAIGSKDCPPVTGYHLYCSDRAETIAAASPVTMGPARARQWNVTKKSTVLCAVTAVNEGGESALSNIVTKNAADESGRISVRPAK